MTEVVEIGFSTNCNCPNGNGDVTIALNARTLYVASESDTSLQSVELTGKSAVLMYPDNPTSLTPSRAGRGTVLLIHTVCCGSDIGRTPSVGSFRQKLNLREAGVA
jgi:hypothetical protein